MDQERNIYLDVFLFIFNNKGTRWDYAVTNDRKVRNNNHLILKAYKTSGRGLFLGLSWSLFARIEKKQHEELT
jgi:hypothetical protein